LIGDPKQSIYGFRGADIHSYLAARRATEGRHYKLGTNFRSSHDLVAAVNQIFGYAEGSAQKPGFSAGAFKFRRGDDNPLPFEAVNAKGRAERLVNAQGALPAMTIWSKADVGNKPEYLQVFAEHCAEHIVTMLNDPKVGFQKDQEFTRLQPADIAILVRDKTEARAIRNALHRRRLASVYLSDKDSVMESQEAQDLYRILLAASNPLDGVLARAAFATATVGLSLPQLAQLATDDSAWEQRVEQLKSWHLIWQRQGVLAMLRKCIHELGLAASLLAQSSGERSLTNLLHLAEILQTESEQLDGEHSLIRWLGEQISEDSHGSDEYILRLESDAELLKVCTIHKSKGLEYPLVFLPFVVSAKPVSSRGRSYYEYRDDDGEKQIDFSLSKEAELKVEAARMEEDLRLLYVALTRARHAMYLGVASVRNKIELSAMGYLLAGGAALTGVDLVDSLNKMRADLKTIQIEALSDDGEPVKRSYYRAANTAPDLHSALPYQSAFEKNWSVGSFSALKRASNQAALPARVLDDKTQNFQDDAEQSTQNKTMSSAARHQFPRGARPGEFCMGNWNGWRVKVLM